MTLKVEHIGIAVKDLQKSEALFKVLLGSESYKREQVKSENVNVSFFRSGDTKIELLESTDPGSAISKFIEKKGEGMHHLAFAVENILASIRELKEAGFEFIMDEPKEGADNKLICFLHPKSTNGVLVELCQEKS